MKLQKCPKTNQKSMIHNLKLYHLKHGRNTDLLVTVKMFLTFNNINEIILTQALRCREIKQLWTV